MKRVGVLVAILCLAWMVIPFMPEGSSLAKAQDGPRLTAEQAIIAARRNAKPGSSFTVLWEVVSGIALRRVASRSKRSREGSEKRVMVSQRRLSEPNRRHSRYCCRNRSKSAAKLLPASRSISVELHVRIAHGLQAEVRAICSQCILSHARSLRVIIR